MQPKTTRIPGKLYLAGEFAVVSSGQPAILTTVDKFLEVTSTPSTRPYGTLKTKHSATILKWQYDTHGNVSVVGSANEQFSMLWKSITLVSSLVEQPKYFDIEITTDLETSDGQKYGLGSSAAVTVGLVRNLIEQYHLFSDEDDWHKRIIFYKISVVAHHLTNQRGSYGDIAACALTGLVFYQNFDHIWFEEQDMDTETEAFLSLITMQWPQLIVRNIPYNHDWQLSVAWTAHPSSTAFMIDDGDIALSDDQFNQTKQLLKDRSKPLIETLRLNLEKSEWLFFKNGLHANERMIKHYTDALNKTYQTPKLKEAVTLARDCQAASKISGAGGGDCAIAISPDLETKNAVEHRWEEAQINNLHLSFWTEDGETS